MQIDCYRFKLKQALDADTKAIQQINFTANLERAGNTRFYFILEEARETVLVDEGKKIGINEVMNEA